MARKVSPTDPAIEPINQPEGQLVPPSRQKPANSKAKPNSGTRKNAQSSREEIQFLKEQLAQREAEIFRLSNENQLLIKEKEQRATELQIINNIGQTLTEGLDLDITLERVGERLREALNIKSLGIVAFDPQAGSVISNYFYHYGRRFAPQFSISDYKFSMRLASRVGYKPWVVNTNIEKYWKKFGTDILTNWTEIPKAFVMVPMLSGRELVGSISLGDYENENAFENLPLNLLETIASNIGTTIQNVRLFDETQRLLKETEQRATELQIINNIGHTLTEGLDLNSMIERVAERLHEALRVDNIAITIINPNTGQVIAQNKIFHNTNPSFASDRFSLDKFKSLMRLSARGGNRSWVMNTNAEKSWRKYAGNVLEGDNIPKSFVALPLLVGRSSIGGIIFADYEKENAFIDLPVRMLETIAYNMGTGIQNVLLFDETQYLLKQTVQRATELQIINNIGQTLTEGGDLNTMTQHVGERIQEALQVSNLVVSLLDKKTGHVLAPYMVRNGKQVAVTEENVDLNRYKLAVRASARAGGASWVVNTNAEKSWRKFWINPVDNEVPKSFVSMPFLVGREVIGGITIADYENENAFSDLSVNLLETIASNMGTAVQNVRLFDETQRLLKETEQRAAELQIINNIGQTLTEGLDLDSTLERVGDRLREVLKIESIGIVANEIRTGLVISSYVYLQGKRIHPNYPAWGKNMFGMRFAARVGGKPLVVTTNVKKNWWRFIADVPEWAEIPKAFVIVPLLADRELVGSITIADYENENAFANLPFDLLQTIASNMGTAIQNAYLFNETQRLLKETEQRAAELQIINNIGQTLTDGLDLNSALERVGERLLTSLKLKNIGIVVFDPKSDLGISHYLYVDGKRVSAERFSLEKFRSCIRLSMRGAGRSWVVNTNAEKIWRKYGAYEDKTAKSFVMLPLLAGKEVIGGITILDYERENAFSDLSIGLIETIASNMGTTIQNVRLFDETQRLLKETEQRATELQIINNIGQTLTDGLDLQSTLERVGNRLREVLKPERIGITVFDEKIEHIIAHYGYRNGKRDSGETYSLSQIRASLRLSARGGGRSWVVNRNAEKSWRIFGGVDEVEIPKSFAKLPLHAGGKVVGGMTLGDYTKEDAFTDISIGMLETIASNIGTAIQNARLFEETQRLLKQTEQRATELQIINNIGQTLTEGGDLNSTLQRVGARILEALNVKDIVISVFDEQTNHVLSSYMVRNGRQVEITEENIDLRRFKLGIRASARAGGRSWVVNTVAEKTWRKWWISMVDNDVPRSFVTLPLLAVREVIGGITIADYEKENAFSDLSVNLLETIASNMGTAIQNVRLFDETKELFKEAEDARTSAERANKTKSTFLANMSHELRTPLNAIIGFTRIVKRKAEGALPEKQIDNLDKVLVSSEHLLGLINTVLDIAKIEAGRMDVIPSKFSVATLADQCATLAMPLLKPTVTLEKQVDETLGFIFSDQDKIKQIVLNLLSNAAKFTHEGKIVLAVNMVETYTSTQVNKSSKEPVYLSPCVRVSVTDSGIGISEEALGRVFEEFQQADNTTTRQYGGTGLGLTISRNLARLLGGDLTATSEVGKGSTFTLTLPIQYGKKPALQQAQDSASSEAKTASAQSAELQADDLSTQQNGNRDSLKTILIVEDTELNIQLLTQLLESDYNLLVAKDGAQGVSVAQEEHPDLILMDISLPIIDGYEATRRIRTTMNDVPIIGLSAHAMSGDAERAKEAGCNDYMTKPVDEILLIKKLNQFLR